MIYTIEWYRLYNPSMSPVFLSFYAEIPSSILLFYDCCVPYTQDELLELLKQCKPNFQSVHICNLHSSNWYAEAQTVLRSNPEMNWVVVPSVKETRIFLEEEEKWHQHAREKIESNQVNPNNINQSYHPN